MSFKDIRVAVESVSNEKGVSEHVVFGAIEAALAAATKRRERADAEFRVSINWDADDYETFRVWHVIDPNEVRMPEEESGKEDTEVEVDDRTLFNPDMHLTPEQATEHDPELKIGDVWEEPWKSVAMGRIVAQTARQVIFQKVREAERERVAREYRPQIGKLVSGKVSRTGRDSVIVDLGNNAEGILLREHLIPREILKIDTRVRAYLVEVDPENKGPQLILTRTSSEMLVELFKREIPEIADSVIQIRAAARDPGERAKIAVSTNDRRIDAVGACVGMRGSRVQNISNEIANERVDVIVWDDDPAQLVINAMSPAEIEEIDVDEDLHTMDLVVKEDNASQAIGKNGQNVRLASELTGWTLNILKEDEAEEKKNKELQLYVNRFITALAVDDEVAQILVEEGFTTVEEIAYVPTAELLAIEGFDSEIVEELRERAKDTLLTESITGESADGTAVPSEELRNMRGMDEVLSRQLAANGVVSMDDLADLSILELQEIDSSISDQRAGQLILTAREPWFEEEES